MSLTCEFCNKSFCSKSSLNNHKKTAKYCLEIQNRELIDVKEFKCKYCKKKFCTQELLNKHELKCIDFLNGKLIEKDEIIEKQKEDISNLEKKVIELDAKLEIYKEQGEKSFEVVEQIAKQPKQQVNNNQKILINTPLDLSNDAVVQAIQEKFSHDYLTQGQKGVAKFAYDVMLKDENGKLKYICTDPSRQIFQYKNDQGVIEKDVRATRLTKAILNAELKQTSHKIAWDNMKDGDNEVFMTYTNHYQEIQGMEQDNSEFSKELSCLTAK
jgi:hypothetical protein|uniref:C2H2-type domain-containing protein n=1 Tax=viral metagenome TaxID=1070528 RepID=A0A6C0J3W5_9ZZZZ